MRNALILLLMLLATRLAAQDCNCTVNFNYTVAKVSKNYAGYNDKVNPLNRKEFNRFTQQLAEKAKATNNIDTCYVLLRTWTNYFKDQHLRVQLDWRYREKYPEKLGQLNKRFAKFKVLPPPATDTLANQTSIKPLSSQTLLISLPSFDYAEKKNVDSLMKKYEAELLATPNWIIDMRGNMGGSDFTYSPFLPYLYTNPIATWVSEYWATADNIAIYEQELTNKNLNKDAAGYMANIVSLMKKNIGKFVNPAGSDTALITLAKVYDYPKKVALLIDRNSASSAESFLLMAKQSKKATVYGENSYGMLDYANYQYFDIPCDAYNLTIPISRSKRLPKNPIDNIGIAPDVSIDNAEKNKIKMIQGRLESANK
ncbi:S41 family peptidase [Pedobacter sp. ASV12]|uniref:S41 family peptidase n=1 Tax=Pedobacter sp. ASV12 TaxID=2795120 RepID=UPI0018EC7CB1|nr:S41 family peptidase [Pedobacter sp. ASV12]